MRTFFRRIVSLLVVVVVGGAAPSDCAARSPRERLDSGLAKIRPSYGATCIEELLALEEEAFDPVTAALLIEKEFDPTINVAELRTKFDALVASALEEGEDNPVINCGPLFFSSVVGRFEPRTPGVNDPRDGFLSRLIRGESCNELARALFVAGASIRVRNRAFIMSYPGRAFIRYPHDEGAMDFEPRANADVVVGLYPTGAMEGAFTHGCIYELSAPRQLVAWLLANRAACRLRECTALNPEELGCLKDAMPSEWAELNHRMMTCGADADLTRAFALDPQHPEVLYGRANAYVMLGDYGRAMGDLTVLLNNCPRSRRAAALRDMVRPLLRRASGVSAESLASDASLAGRCVRTIEELRPSYEATSIEALLALPDEAFDIATAALLIERGVDPTVDVAGLRADLDAAAAAIAGRLPLDAGTREILDAIAVHLNTLPVAERGETDFRDGMLANVLRGRTGNCLGRGLLILSLCRRLEVSASLLDLPHHVLVRVAREEGALFLDGNWMSENARVLGEDIAEEREYNRGRVITSPEGLASMVYANRGTGMFNTAVNQEDASFAPLTAIRPACIPAAASISGLLLERVMEDFDRALALDPWNPISRENQGQALWRLGRREEAMNACAKALALAPDYVPALVLRAGMRYELGDDQGAINDATRALHWDEKNTDALRVRIKAMRRTGMIAGLEEDLRAYIELSGNVAWAHAYLQDIVRARGERTLQFFDGEEAANMYEIALLCFSLGRHCDAVSSLDSAIESGMDNPKVYAMRGCAHSLCGDAAAARADYEKASGMEAATAEDYHWRAEAWVALEEWREAEADAAKAVELEPFVPDHQVVWAAALIGQERYDEATVCLIQVIEQQAEAYDAHARLAMIAVRQRDDLAFDMHMQRALSARYTDASMWRMYIAGCRALGRDEAARKGVAEARRLGVELRLDR